MNKVLFNYLFTGYLKTVLKVVAIFYCFGLILNLFEEVEFFKNSDSSLLIPISLTALYVPNIVIKLLPFIIFISSLWFLLNLRNSTDLLTMKVFGYSNFKIFFILALISFVFGWIILFAINPITSTMVKYYEQTKAKYSRDVDHLISINKNGLWIKDVVNNEINIINSSKIDNNFLTDTFITIFNKDFNLIKSIKSDKIDIKNNQWLIYDATIFKENFNKKSKLIKFNTNFNQKKIESLFSNLSSLSFMQLIDLRKNYESLNYSVIDVDMQINKIISYPLILVLMTILSAIIMFNTKQLSSTYIKIIIGLFFSVSIYYINNFFNVLGSTEKIPITFAIWSPLIFLSILNFLLLIRINDK